MDAAPFMYYIPIFNHLFLLSNKTIVLTINRRTKNDTVFIISVGHINVDSLFNIFLRHDTSYCSPQMEQRYQIYFY